MRIVSLLPSATEIVCGLGLADRLVAVTDECDWPPEVRRLPKVTRTHIPVDAPGSEIDRLVRERARAGETPYTLDHALLRRLRPDLILSQTLCRVCAIDDRELAAVLRDLHPAPRVLYLEPVRMQDVLDSIVRVAEAAEAPERGTRLVAELERRIHAARERRHGRPRLRVVVLEWLDPLFACGHWTPELVEWAGAFEPLARAGERSRTVELEALVAADPDLLLIACCGFDIPRTMREVPGFLARPAVRSMRCVRDGRVYVVDGSAYFSRPSQRLVDSLELLVGLLEGDETDPARAVRVEPP